MRGAWTADRVPPFVPSGWAGPSSTTDSLMAGTTSPFPCLEDRKGQHLEGFCPSAFVIILGNERRGFECPSNQRTSFLEVVHSQGELRAAPDGAEVDRADHVDAGIPEPLRERREGSGLVFESDDEDGPRRAGISVLHQRLAGLHGLARDQADIGPAPHGLRADRIDVDAGLPEDRRDLREFARTIRHVDVNLDQCFLPRSRIAFRAYKRCVPSPGGESLILLRRIRRLDDAIPTDVRGTSGPRHRAVAGVLSRHPRHAGGPARGCRKPRASGSSFGVRVPGSYSNSTGTRKAPNSSRDPTAAAMPWITSPSIARTSKAPTASCWRRAFGRPILPSWRADRSSLSCRIPTVSGSNSPVRPRRPRTRSFGSGSRGCGGED